MLLYSSVLFFVSDVIQVGVPAAFPTTLNHLNKAAGRNLTALSHFGKDKGQVFLAQALLGPDIQENAFYSVDSNKVVVHNGSFGNVLLETSRDFLCVAAMM